MKYYLDTNIIIYFINGKYSSIIDKIKKISSQSIVIPSIVLAEIEYGAKKSVDYNKTITKYRQFINVFSIEQFDMHAAQEYGMIRSSLEKAGNLIGPNDMLIASIVKANDGILVTNNVREFERIEGLHIENWCDA